MRNLGWWNILVVCFASLASAQVLKKCFAPPEYPHTRLDKKFADRQSFNTGEKVYYNCAEDFTPSRGSRAVECNAGKWSRLTLKCEKKSCGNAGDLPNGQFVYEGNSFVGEKVYAECNEGYTLKGLNYMICKRSGWTGEFPSCEEGETTCSTPTVANSVKIGGNVSVYRVGDNVTFTCSQGFQLEGAQQVACGPNGQWQPQPPQCVPSPDKTQQSSDKETGGCGVPLTTKDSNANLADKYITMTSFASGDRVHYMCDVGYIRAGGSRYRTCMDGKWTPLYMTCEPKSCGSAGEILNGQFTYSGIEFGDTATAVCDEGFILVGQATRNCMSNGWDGRIPVCEAVVCAEPQTGTNTEMIGFQEPPYTYRSVIRYHCRVGTLTGQREIWCTKDGTWSAPPPECKEMTCPSPNVPAAFWRGMQKKQFQYRDTLSIECKPGYAISGLNIVTCGHDGRWYPGLPKCRRTSRRSYWRN
ncbi:sushi, von Willebrand factor type A, EGF and pentraxin domain-containing protein 1-like [Lates japonicus]|uniref:Sushi, von Willebrand factor type A, EGF and pentraxin domain-containing protein 1-like protein n=1 Tax=Lates japonicus TaxID=270547 RepID=A0AAD3M9A1_LATJO|nr:sushi, von Willebrand factor type A, EGF and pentraxin domain-containing protein 1-like protein [Lates japonicus]